MCKFKQPTVPQGATDDERRAIMFDALYSLDMGDKTEKRENLTYLSWANAWAEFKRAYPSATYRVIKNPDGLPYFVDPAIGIMVFVEITADGITHEAWIPVMDGRNKAMKLQPYTYQVWDNTRRQYVEKTVQSATMFDVNKTIMRTIVKGIGLFGLGLYIYAGEDMPEKTDVEQPTASTTEKKSTTKRKAAQPKTQPIATDRYAAIRNAINAINDCDSLLTLYNQHRNEAESDINIKNMFSARKHELQQLKTA